MDVCEMMAEMGNRRCSYGQSNADTKYNTQITSSYGPAHSNCNCSAPCQLPNNHFSGTAFGAPGIEGLVGVFVYA